MSDIELARADAVIRQLVERRRETLHIITHHPCNDGKVAACLAAGMLRRAGCKDVIVHEKERDFLPHPESLAGCILYLDIFDKRANGLPNVYALDHHETNKLSIASLGARGVFDIGRCASRIVLDAFRAYAVSQNLPKFTFDPAGTDSGALSVVVALVDDYDRACRQMPTSRAFASAIMTMAAADVCTLNHKLLADVIATGTAQVEEQTRTAQIIIGTGTMENIPFGAANADVLVVDMTKHTDLVTLAGEIAFKTYPSVNVVFMITMVNATDVKFALRSQDTGPNVAVYAEQFGGGGHRGAAGFTCPLSRSPVALCM